MSLEIKLSKIKKLILVSLNIKLNSNMKPTGACVILTKEDKILGVTRKYNHSDWGLPGGKLDPGETALQAIVRETKEETGLDIFNVELLDQRVFKDRLVYLFKAEWSGEIEYDTQTEGLCDWVTWKELLEGSFGQYNLDIKNQYFN
jgi:8-oxo-dGTP pyrophosphatase MutT (NUDIX family)